MQKVAIIGRESGVGAFKFLGVDVFPISTGDQTLEVLKKILEENAKKEEKYSIVFIEEIFMEEVKDFLDKTDLDPTITIVPLPLDGKILGNSIKKTNELIKKAIGISTF